MDLVKKATSLVGLLVATFALMEHFDKNYASKEQYLTTRKRIIQNEKDISMLKKKSKITGSILCGMAIDMELPTAKEECDKIIN